MSHRLAPTAAAAIVDEAKRQGKSAGTSDLTSPRGEVIALRNCGVHYYQTLRHWERNLAARREEASRAAAVENVRRYLRVSAAAFKHRLICLLRVGFAKAA